MSLVVKLRRFNTSQPWGFKMQGGVDVGSPLFAAHGNVKPICSLPNHEIPDLSKFYAVITDKISVMYIELQIFEVDRPKMSPFRKGLIRARKPGVESIGVSHLHHSTKPLVVNSAKARDVFRYNKVSPNSISGQAGLQAGDAILMIGGTDVTRCTHEEARGEMIRAGNEFDLTVQRGAVPAPCGQVVQEEPPRMSVSDDGGPYQDVQPKTYRVLEKEQASGAKPASIFDKRRQDRSAYTKTDKSGYQKALGEK